MIYIDIKIDGIWCYISHDDLKLTEPYDGHLVSAPGLQFGMKEKFGGFEKPELGSITLLMELFSTVIIPPVSCEIIVRHSLDTEANGIVLFEGTAHLSDFDEEIALYDLYDVNSAATENAKSYEDTLDNVVAEIATALGLAVDLTASRSPSPAVQYTTPSSDEPLREITTDIVSFFSHLVYEDDGTLFLVDMKADNGEMEAPYISEYSYMEDQPIFKVSETTFDNEVINSYEYGKEKIISPVCAETTGLTLEALENINDVLLMKTLQITAPLDDIGKVVFGKKIYWLDEEMPETINGWLRINSVSYDFDSEFITIAGIGEVSIE